MIINQLSNFLLLCSKHIIKWIFFPFNPKITFRIDFFRWIYFHPTHQLRIRIWLWRIHNSIFPLINRSSPRLKLSNKEVIPTFKSPMRFTSVHLKLLPICISLRTGLEPTMRLLFIKILQRNRFFQHLAITIKDIFQMLINQWVSQEQLPVRRVHQINENWHEYQTCVWIYLHLWRFSSHITDNLEHIFRFCLI